MLGAVVELLSRDRESFVQKFEIGTSLMFYVPACLPLLLQPLRESMGSRRRDAAVVGGRRIRVGGEGCQRVSLSSSAILTGDISRNWGKLLKETGQDLSPFHVIIHRVL